MKKKKNVMWLLILAMSLVALVGCNSSSENEDASDSSQSGSADVTESEAESGEPVYGGEITVAFQSSPENFDPDHASSDWTVTAVTNHVYEGLFEFNAAGEAVPQLAESYTVSEDGKEYTFILRDDVLFSDGDNMVASDVVASLERWLEVNDAGVAIAPYIDSIEIVNDYEFKVYFNIAYAPFINNLASPVSRQKLLIKKEEIIEEFGTDIITEHIGTGPYCFEEIEIGQKVVLVRNDNYVAAQTGEISGLAGERIAYLDKITIEFVSEESVRIAGLQSGLYDFIDEVTTDHYESLESYPDIEPVVCEFGTMGVVAFNSANEVFSQKSMRQAVAYAIDMTEMAIAQVGDEQFWELEDGSWFSEGSIWYDATAGEGIFNTNDVEKAKELIEESDYNGEVITILVPKDDSFVEAGSLILQSQLIELGLNVEVEIYDRATYYEYLEADKWDINVQRWSAMNPDPQVFQPWTGTDCWITGWDDEESLVMDEIFERMVSAMDYESRYEIVTEFYDYFWETVPYFKMYNDVRLYAMSESLEGFQSYGQPYFWNVWLEE